MGCTNPHNPGNHLGVTTVIPLRAVVWLIVGALGLPIALCVLFGLARLLEAMQDQAGAFCLGRVSLALAVVWVIDLIALVVIQAINSLGGPPSQDGEK